MTEEFTATPRKSKTTPQWRIQKIAHKNRQIQQRRTQSNTNSGNSERSHENDGQDPDGIETRRARGSQAPRAFSQPSVISSGDNGIFVTTDIGKEKKGLIEIAGLVEEYLEDAGLLGETSQWSKEKLSAPTTDTVSANTSVDPADEAISQDEEDSDMDIEASIERELSAFITNPSNNKDQQNTTSTSQARRPAKPFQLITLDIPCVSFLRFHPLHPAYSRIDPVFIAHSICDEAMKTGTMRSRFIRRLSPITWLGKTLAEGLEKGSEMVLPRHFEVLDDTAEQGPSPGQTKGGVSFAIRPSIRNNSKLSRDDIIKTIADRVTTLGKGRHKVDLKNYQKGILVEVYRGWVGMSVVDNKPLQVTDQDGSNTSMTVTNQFQYGYEELKRFNLAEVYAEGLKRSE